MRMHSDEVATDVGLVRRLVAAQFPEWAALPVEPLEPWGTDNALYRLGRDKIVRLPRIEWAAGGVDKDAEWLPRLAPLLPVASFAHALPPSGVVFCCLAAWRGRAYRGSRWTGSASTGRAWRRRG